MSDINLNLDGLIAFLVAAALGSCLVLGIVVCSIYGWLSSRKKRSGFSSQTVFPHIIGILLSTGGCVIILLLIFLQDGPARPHDLALWLDNWVLLWMVGLLLLWPLTVWTLRMWRQPKPQSDL